MSSRLSEKDFDRWRERIRFARRVWEHQGLIGDKHPSTMRLLIDMYRSNPDAHIGGGYADLDRSLYATVNKVFPVANTLMGEIAARTPRVQVFPRSEQHVQNALPIEHLVNYDLEEMGWKRQTNKALLHALFAPMGFLQHGFTPRREYENEKGRRLSLYRPAKPDRPWVKARPIWDVLLDPARETFHVDEGLEWVAFRDLMWLQDIKDNPDMVARRDLERLRGNVRPDWSSMLHLRGIPTTANPDDNEMVEVYTVYEARERTWFQLVLDGVDRPLREPDDWPVPWETLPVSIFSTNEQMDTPFPLPIMDVVAPIQVELNRLRTMMGQLVFRLRRIIGYNKGLIDESELTKAETAAVNEFIAFKGDPESAMKMLSSGGFPLELLQYNSLLEEDIREGIGQSKMGRAQRINVTTAHEVERVQQGQDISTGRIVEAFQEFNQDAIRLYMQGRRATMAITGPEVVRIVGQQDADGLQQWAEISPDVLHGDFEYHVVYGSTLPLDRDRDAQKAGADLTLAMGAPSIFNVAFFARRYLEARGIEPTRALSKTALVAAATKALDELRRDAQIGEEGPAGGGFDANVAAQLSAGLGSSGAGVQ